ncbi:MAG: replicative DNA helicase [Syntrophomonadaceae bacterium]|nr:replicative DNA helicase [Syntrophomonadaceae bacterium]MDD4549675.1 replicative DNA helicase [Syntrophomonadaceae bacterium]
MYLNIAAVTANYRERIQRLALFEPLFKLENKKTSDNSNMPIDYFSLGLLALLFFFENMLMRNKKTGVKDLAVFLEKVNQGKMDINKEGFEKLARTIVESFRPPSGQRNFKSYYNWETMQEETVYYSILKADRFDTRSNTQYYTLDEQGLELVFATREYFSEFQISINQLLLRKQLEKGEFSGALRQIDEMRIAVQSLQERIIRIKHEIQRNIVSDQTYKRYRETVEDIHLRLTREDEEFEELQSFVRDTRERQSYRLKEEKDRKTYDLIIQIDRELGDVHHQHTGLLRESIELKTTALQAAQESLYYAGIDSFNWQKEISDRLISTPLPLTATRRLVEPMLFLEKSETWSPLTVFAAQRLESGGETKKSEVFLELIDEEEQQIGMEILSRNFRRIMEIILEVMGEKKEITFQEVVSHIKEKQNYQYLLYNRLFYDFWLILHQRSPLQIKNQDEEASNIFFNGVIDLLKDKCQSVMVQELGQVVKATPRYSIRDMSLRLEEKADVI